MKAMAKAHPGWRFTGVDPAGPMLDLASKVLGANAHRADLIEGTIDDAPAGPFDGATRSEEHTSELQSLMRISYAVFCLKKKKQQKHKQHTELTNQKQQ